jgi:hypothetical protein
MHIKTKVYLHLALFSILLYLINLAFNNFVYEIYFIIPLWKIYAFNTALVLVTFWTMKILTKTKINLLFSFVIASLNKMLLTIIFVYPIIHFDGDKDGLILTFFIIYFIFLFFEIKSLQKSL